MIPMAITREQATIAEFYWGKSWTFLSADQVQEALDWWNAIDTLDRWLEWSS
jgi:hypothetical protein